MKKLLLLLLVLTFVISCDDNTTEVINGEVVQINYGTSFGFCFGYCVNEITVTHENITLEKSGWTDSAGLPKITYQEELSAEVLNDVFAEVDFDEFLKLDEVIGCPDCSDGGTEWIEITTKDKTHRVSFDYYLDDEPAELTAIMEPLRDLYSSLQRESYVLMDNDLYTTTETSNYTINDVTVDGNSLKLSIASSGCDGNTWIGLLIDAESILESLPVQRQLKLNLVNNEACLAVISKEIEFDISSLQVEGENTVHFNLEGWTESIVYNY